MKDLSKLLYKRKFSFTPYKSLRLNLGKFSLAKDFVTDKRGDLYPVLGTQGEISERIYNGHYIVNGNKNSFVSRLLGEFFPYASYEVTLQKLSGKCGFEFCGQPGRVSVLFNSKTHRAELYEDGSLTAHSPEIAFQKGMKFEVSCRVSKFDVYVLYPDELYHRYAFSFSSPAFKDANRETVFKNITAALAFYSGEDASCVCISDACFYLDSGISIADMRPIRYENGEIMTEDGKVFLTVSVRLQEGAYQGVLTWVPGTAEFELVGAVFFDVGDGIWGADVASSIVFNRFTSKWNIWYCSFSHGHILASAECEGEVRYGINLLDTKLMQVLPHGADDRIFLGKEGDEDPNFIFDSDTKKWYMTICRLASDGSGYKYYLFETDSENPFAGWKYVTNSANGEETGGSILNVDGRLTFVCGNSFSLRANYRVYNLPDFSNFTELKFDYDDGGFRGWGTIIPMKKGTREIYYHLTFDRHNGSNVGYNWSYGNIYCFEATKM